MPKIRSSTPTLRACCETRVRSSVGELDAIGLRSRRQLLAASQLSRGENRKLWLIAAKLAQPELLLLDEPTASLDPDTADWVRGYLESYRRASGAAILLASHNMGEVERLCDTVLMMRQGRIVDRGTPAELLRRYGRRNLEEVLLDIARDRRRGAHDRATTPTPTTEEVAE